MEWGLLTADVYILSIAERSTARRIHCDFVVARSGVRDFECMQDVSRQVVRARAQIADSYNMKLVTLAEWAGTI